MEAAPWEAAKRGKGKQKSLCPELVVGHDKVLFDLEQVPPVCRWTWRMEAEAKALQRR